MSRVSGNLAVEFETGRLVEEIAQRTAVLVVSMLHASGGYDRDPEPGQGGSDPDRGQHSPDSIGMEGLG